MSLTFETERLILRPWCDGDAAELYRYASDSRVGPAAGWNEHTSVENSLEIIRTVLSEEGTYAVCLKETGLPVGSIGYFPSRAAGAAEGEYEIGYWIGVPYWGKGYIPEAVAAIQEYCFTVLDTAGIWCGYFDGNDKSRRVQEKCGFVYNHTENGMLWAPTGKVLTEHFTYISHSAWLAAYIAKRLAALSDSEYAEFQCRLMPGISRDKVVGVRTPALRALAKELAKRRDIGLFLGSLPHATYDENNLHGFIISLLKDYGETVAEVERFLPYVDNWATCDLMSPKAFAKHTEELKPKCLEWMSSGKTYTVRFGMEMLMTYFLGGRFTPDVLEKVVEVRSDEYYVNMMAAWFFATALAKQYDAAVTFIEEKRLTKWTHNKAIQKSTESFRVTDAHKQYLRTLKY